MATDSDGETVVKGGRERGVKEVEERERLGGRERG